MSKKKEFDYILYLDINEIAKEVFVFPKEFGRVWLMNDNIKKKDINGRGFIISEAKHDNIRSVGEDIKTGKIYASTSNNFYSDNPDYKCIWLK